MTRNSTKRPLSILVAADVDEICELMQHWLANAGHELPCMRSMKAR